MATVNYGLSASNPDKAFRYRGVVFQDVFPGPNQFVYYLATGVTRTTIQLPPSVKLTQGSDADLDWNILDKDAYQQLQQPATSKTINWCRTVRPLYPIKLCQSPPFSDAAGVHSLLKAVLVEMCGLDDDETVTRLGRLVHVALSDDCWQLKNRWIQQQQLYEDRRNDVRTRWPVISAAFGIYGSSSSGSSGDRPHTVVPPTRSDDRRYNNVEAIHVFALSNVLGRPIILLESPPPPVLYDVIQSSSQETSSATETLTGVYLPLCYPDYSRCVKSPLLLTLCNGRFCPLVALSGHDSHTFGGMNHAEPDFAVPLTKCDMSPLPVRCLLTSEQAEVLLSAYLRTTEVPYTTSTGCSMIPAARIEAVAPPAEYDLVSSWINHDVNTSNHRGHLLPSGLIVGSTIDPLSSTVASAESASESNSRMCQNPGCQFFGSQERGWLCSKCYAERFQHQQPFCNQPSFEEPRFQQQQQQQQQQLLTAATQSVIPGPSGSRLLRPASRSVSGIVTTSAPPSLTSFDLRSPTICSIPSCSQRVTEPGKLYCFEHQLSITPIATSQSATSSLTITSAVAPVFPSLDEQQLVIWNSAVQAGGLRKSTSEREQTTVRCAAAGCDMFGTVAHNGFCSAHYATQVGLAFASESVNRHQVPLCRNAGCSRQGSPSYNGECSQCFIGLSSNTKQTVAGREGKIATGFSNPVTIWSQGGGLTSVRAAEGDLSKRELGDTGARCLMDFCNNAAIADYKGLCRQCYATLCKHRLMDENEVVPVRQPAASASAVVTHSESRHAVGGTAVASQRCVMDGCRKPALPGQLICEGCYSKQEEALTGFDVRKRH